MTPAARHSDQEKNQNELSFDKFYIKRTQALETETDYNGRRRHAMAILMNKRNRGDMFGFIPEFDNYAELEYIDVSDAGLLKWNIFEPIVRANNSNALNVNLQYIWEAATNDPDLEAGAEIANSVMNNYLRPRFYTEDVREGMCELAQLSHAFFLYIGFNKNKDTFKIRRAKKRIAQVPLGYEIYTCQACGYKISKDDYQKDRELQGQIEFDDARDQIAAVVPPEVLEPQIPAADGGRNGGQIPPTLPPNETQSVMPGALLESILKNEQEAFNSAPVVCPDCAAQMSLSGEVEMIEQEVPDGYEEVSAGDFEFKLVSSFEILIDERNAKRGNCRGGHWMCYRHLEPFYEIEESYPQTIDELKHQTEMDWSEANQWLRALETSGDIVRRFNNGLTGIDRLFEVKEWYFQPNACGSWTEPEGWELKGKNKQVIFSIRPGETVKQACLRQFGKFIGLRIDIIGDRIVDVKTEFKNEHWDSGHWMANALAFWGKGQESLLDLQHAVNEFFNMMYEHISHESMPHTILDGLMFDGEDFRNEAGNVSYTRPGLTREKPIGDYIHQLPPQRMSPESWGLFSYILGQGKQEMSGVYPGSVGGSDPNVKTKGGQQMMIQRALGLETPFFKSEKRAVQGFFENGVRVFQQNMPTEAYSYVKAANGEELKDIDIEIFRRLVVGRDIILKAVDGTDLPQTHVEMRENYALAMQMMLFAPSELSGIPPEIQSKMLKLLRIDYDADNYNDHKRNAYARVKLLKELCADAQEESFLDDGAIDPNMIVDVLAKIPFLQRQDNHLVHVGVLDAFCVAESAKPSPNYLLIACLQQRAMQHYQQIQAAQSEALLKQAGAEGGAERIRRSASGEDEQMRRQEEREDAKNSADQETSDRQTSEADILSMIRELLAKSADAEESERARQHESGEKAKDRRHQEKLAKSSKRE